MSTPLRVLLVEDRSEDAELIEHALRGSGFTCVFERIDNETDYVARLDPPPDVILADFRLPQFDALRALLLMKQRQVDVPFIIVSGTIGEELAVKALKHGATDYLLKDRLTRLGQAVAQALEQKRLRTEMRKAQAALRASEANLARSQQIAHLGNWIWNVTDDTVEWSDEMFRIYDVDPDQFDGRSSTLSKLIRVHPEDLWRQREVLHTLSSGQLVEPFQSRIMRRDGSIRTVQLVFADIERDPSGKPSRIFGISLDVTDRKHAEAERERLATAVVQATESIFITDPNGTIQYVNPAFERTTGYSATEALGQNPRILKSGKHTPEFYRQMWNSLINGEPWSGRFVNRRKDGTFFEEEASISPIRDAAGRVTNYVAVKRDVTREAALETQLLQTQKMEAVGRLAGGVAHDFNNILTAILGYSDLLIGRLKDHPRLRGCAEEIKVAAERATALTRQLLIFSRKQVAQPQVLDLNAVVTNLNRMLRRLIGENIQLVTITGASLKLVKADPGQIEQVLLNLVVNARDAMPQGGQLTVSTRNLALDAVHPQTGLPAGKYVQLTVRDTGTGMTSETLSHLFEPFFTTKEVGKGTGLGLSTVYGIIKQSGGHIFVESQPGEGTSFDIFLPQAEVASEEAKSVSKEPPLPGGCETVLLVEDDRTVRALASEMLSGYGYRVLEAGSSAEASRQADQEKGRIDLLLTDIVLPDINGVDSAQTLLKMHPEMRLLYMSGYSDAAESRIVTLRPEDEFLKKPFEMDEFLRKVRVVLDAQRGGGSGT